MRLSTLMQVRLINSKAIRVQALYSISKICWEVVRIYLTLVSTEYLGDYKGTYQTGQSFGALLPYQPIHICRGGSIQSLFAVLRPLKM